MQGIKDNLAIYGYVSLKSPDRWEWKHSNMSNKHLMYRHLNVPIQNNSQYQHEINLPIGSIKTVKNVVGKADEGATVCPSFYDRNNLSQSAKRKRDRMSRSSRRS